MGAGFEHCNLPWAMTDMLRMLAGLSMRPRIWVACQLSCSWHVRQSAIGRNPWRCWGAYLFDGEAVERIQSAIHPTFKMQGRPRELLLHAASLSSISSKSLVRRVGGGRIFLVCTHLTILAVLSV